jgi:hypothetical protein
MLTVDIGTKAPRRRTAQPSVSRCGSWHGSASTCPCHLNRLADSQVAVAAVPQSVADTVREPGSPLDEPIRRQMQERLGHDFGAVRLHSGQRAAASARAVRALAYTVGEHVVLDQDRLPAAPSDRDTVLAHELVHTVQQGTLAGRRLADRVSEPDDSHEHEAHRVAGSPQQVKTPAPAGAVHRAPTPQVENPPGISLTIREDGRLDVVARGPKAPVVGKPAAGLRRNVDGSYTVVFGADEKVVSPSEIPPMLRGMVAGAARGDVAPRSFRIPSCASLRSIDQTRWMTYDEYRVTQLLSPDVLPLTPLFYDELIASCSAARTPPPTAPLDARPPAAAPDTATPPHEALPPLLPEGQALA